MHENACINYCRTWHIRPASGICNRAATARIAERFSSSCFSNSCLTEFAFTFVVHVARSGSTIWSKSVQNEQTHYVSTVQSHANIVHKTLQHSIVYNKWLSTHTTNYTVQDLLGKCSWQIKNLSMKWLTDLHKLTIWLIAYRMTRSAVFNLFSAFKSER